MPFTASHPALILPFLKNKKLSATALIIGTMSPDFEYFFRMKIQSEISHTFLGIFLIDFPLGFIVMFAFHEIIKKPFIENLPVFFQKRMGELKIFDWLDYFKKNVFIVLSSFLLGTFSHILWDSFTHWDGFFVLRFSFFNLTIYSIPLFKIAQHLSSIIGLVIISWYFFKLPANTNDIKIIDMKYWYLSVLLSVVMIVFRFCFGTDPTQIGDLIVSVISSIAIAITLTGFIFRNKKTI